jgi:hypothetical protein
MKIKSHFKETFNGYKKLKGATGGKKIILIPLI